MDDYRKERIKKYLLLASSAHLGDCLDLLFDERIVRLYDMIEHYRRNKMPKADVARMVADDVAVLVGGGSDKLHMDSIV